LNFLDKSSKNIKISKFMPIRSTGPELFHADEGAGGQMEMKPIVAFRNFANAPKNLANL
jgi:hypothetical protein